MSRTRDEVDVYRGQDPANIPFCTLAECAAWLDLPSSTVRAWFLGQRQFKPVLDIADRATRTLSFVNLTEVFVLASIRREHQVPLPQVRKAVRYLRKLFDDDHPLARQEMMTEGSALLIQHLGVLVSASEDGQIVSQDLVLAYLRRIERDATGLPLRIYPFTRPTIEHAPTSVSIDPRVQFGRPCLKGTGIPTSVIHERWLAGEDIEEIARDYGREPSDVQEALRFENRRAA